MEDQYTYTPLQKGEIRLLEILPGQPEDQLQCHLRVVSLEDATAFELGYAAVSYAWGEDLSDRTIIVDGRRLSVKPNLEAALFEFRREPPRLVPETLTEQVSIVKRSLKSMLARYYESSSAASRADYDELHRILLAYPTVLSKEPDDDAKIEIQKFFIRYIHKILDQIAGREGSPRLCEEPIFFWIDGICINQNDGNERIAQVQMMGRIYYKAAHLVIWLGPGDKHSDAAMEILGLFKEDQESNFNTWLTAQLPAETKDFIYMHLARLFSTQWFERAWIVQEYVLCAGDPDEYASTPEPIIVCCGRNRFQDLVSNIVYGHSFLTGCPFKSNCFNAVRLAGLRVSYKTHRSKMGSGTDLSKGFLLLKTVTQSNRCHVTDPRDRIYSCLGLADAYFNGEFGDYVPAGLVIDYNSSVEDVYSSFVKAVTEITKRLDTLAFCRGKLTKYVRRTWTPDWDADAESQNIPSGILRNFFMVLPTTIAVEELYIQDMVFNSTPGVNSIATFADDLSTITVAGLIYDRFTDNSSMIIRELADLQDLVRQLLEREGNSTQKCSEFEGLLQTLELKSDTSDGLLEPQKLMETLLEGLKLNSKVFANELKQLQTNLKESNDLTSLIQTTVNFHNEHDKGAEDDTPGALHGKSVTNLARHYGNTLVLTEGSNIVRPLTDDPRPGDLICVILGCAMPLLLRPFDGYYELHGEVYVPGIMHGEAMEALKEGKLVLQDFELH